MRVYVAAPTDYIDLANEVQRRLVERGHRITHDWTAAVKRRLAGVYEDRAVSAEADIAGVQAADVVVALHPSHNGRGVLCEIGGALAAGKTVVWYEPEQQGKPCVFASHPLSIVIRAPDIELVLEAVGAFGAADSRRDRPGALTIAEVCEEAYETARNNGFWNGPLTAETAAVKLALVHTEVSEALEEVRSGAPFNEVGAAEGEKPEGFATELADIVIRVADLAEAAGVELEQCVRRKLAYNRTRPYKHGKAF